MRSLFFLLLFGVSVVVISQEPEQKVIKGLETNVAFSLHSNGMAPIPAFALDKPAVVASVGVKKGRFSYDPALYYSYELKPWFFDNWFHYRIISRPEFELVAGANISIYNTGIEINNEEIQKAERYLVFSMTGTYYFSPVSSLAMDYWSDNGLEPGSLRGHFTALSYKRSNVGLGKSVLLSFGIMLFYINYSGNNDGFFIAPEVSLAIKTIPVSLFFNANQAIQSNIDPRPGFKWNVGITYDL